MKKVALLGNMNNNFFALCRYLRDQGIDAELLIFNNEFEHFEPLADSYDESYKKYVKKLGWGDFYQFNSSLKELVIQDLKAYEFLIGCGTSPAYLSLIGRKLDIFIPYGADLFYLPFFKYYYMRKPITCLNFMRYQRKGLRESKHILFDQTNEIFEKTLDKLNIKSNRIVSTIPMVYVPQYTKENFKNFSLDSKLLQRVAKIRDSTEILMIHNSRHCWKKCKENISIKNNHHLFYALSELVKQTDKSIKLITFEYGIDSDSSKKLVDKLALNDYVEWIPLVSRKELMGIMNMCDLVIGEFNLSWFTYGVVIEAMSLSKPIMHYREDKLYTDFYEELYPMLNARSSEEILKQLLYVVENKEKIVEIGVNSKKWLDKYIIDTPLKSIIKIIEGNNEQR